jgi:hypothetical protein
MRCFLTAAQHKLNLWRFAAQCGQPARGLLLNECFHAPPNQLRFFSAGLCQGHGFGKQIVIDGHRCSHGSFSASIKHHFASTLTSLPASAASSTSTQWRTGVAVPLCKCVMQPMFAETMVSGFISDKFSSLRSRSA